MKITTAQHFGRKNMPEWDLIVSTMLTGDIFAVQFDSVAEADAYTPAIRAQAPRYGYRIMRRGTVVNFLK